MAKPGKSLWNAPERLVLETRDRSVSFLELFYDLVFVILIAKLVHHFASHLTLEGLGTFVLLFFIIWWGWFNGAVYHDIHGKDDLRTRVFVFAQMFAVIAMALFIEEALGDGGVGFALSYAALQLILTWLWWRTGLHDRDHAKISAPYSLLFLVNSILFIISAFVPSTLRITIWIIAVTISFLLPMTMTVWARRDEVAMGQMRKMIDVNPSLVERFGLFTIIVIGEIIVGIVAGMGHLDQIDLRAGVVGLLAATIAVGVWWTYFDFISHRRPSAKIIPFYIWYYGHVPIVIAIALVGVGLDGVVAHHDEVPHADIRWVLVASVAIIMLTVALLAQVVRPSSTEYQKPMERGSMAMALAGIGVLIIGLASLDPLILLSMLAILLLIPIAVGIATWARLEVAEEE